VATDAAPVENGREQPDPSAEAAPRRGRPTLSVPAQDDSPRVRSTKELAQLLGVPQYLVEVLAVVHEIPRMKVGQSLVYDQAGQERVRAALRKFHESKERQAAERQYLCK
jgi:hypothetical protein